MSLEDIFRYISLKLDGFGQNLAEGWGTGKDWSCKSFGEITPGTPEKGQSTNLYLLNTAHPFGQYRFTDFHKTWQEYVSECPRESFRSEILKFFC